MVKILLNIMICATLLLGGNMQQNIQYYLTNYNCAQIAINGNCYDVKEVDDLNSVLITMLQDSHTMPAYGVSLHNETIAAVQNGVWLILNFEDENWLDDMNFDQLLINVEPDFSGFNIIRGNNGKYEGRCYYIDLSNTTMKLLYDWIKTQAI